MPIQIVLAESHGQFSLYFHELIPHNDDESVDKGEKTIELGAVMFWIHLRWLLGYCRFFIH